MHALTARPGEPDSLKLETLAVPEPGAGEAQVRVLEIGLDGTDNEVIEGGGGRPPSGRERLIVGHESLGEVVAVGSRAGSLCPGDLVVATVRRPCAPACQPCLTGDLDMCPSETYVERGIQGEDGFAAEHFTERAEYLVPVPPPLREVAILTEPMSIALKGIERAYHFQSHFDWRPRKALVTGGSLALLAALLLRLRGLEVTAVARSAPDTAKARLIKDMGGQYVRSGSEPLEQSVAGERFDFIFEATGVSSLVFQSLCRLAPNGVLCLAGLPQGDQKLDIPADAIGLNMVLENRIMFGTVNSNRGHFERALSSMQDIEARMPGLLGRVVTARFPLDQHRRALEKPEIKNVITFEN